MTYDLTRQDTGMNNTQEIKSVMKNRASLTSIVDQDLGTIEGGITISFINFYIVVLELHRNFVPIFLLPLKKKSNEINKSPKS